MADDSIDVSVPDVSSPYLTSTGALTSAETPTDPGVLSNTIGQYLQAQQPQQAPQGLPNPLTGGTISNPFAGQGGLALALAGGMDKYGPMGGAARAALDHFNLQDKLKDAKDRQDLLLKMQQAKLDEQKRLNDSKITNLTSQALKNGMPKVTPIAGGAYSQVVDPKTGEVSILSNDEAQKFKLLMQENSIQGQLAVAGVKIDSAPESAGIIEKRNEAQAKVYSEQATLDKFDQAERLLKHVGAPELANLPFVDTVNQYLGTDAADAARSLAQLKVDASFSGQAKGQGAISDYERKMLNAPVPAPTASTATWLKYITERREAVTKYKAFLQTQADAFNQAKNGQQNAQAAIAQRQADFAQKYPGSIGAQRTPAAQAGSPAPSPGQVPGTEDVPLTGADMANVDKQAGTVKGLATAMQDPLVTAQNRKAASDNLVKMLNLAEKGKLGPMKPNDATLADNAPSQTLPYAPASPAPVAPAAPTPVQRAVQQSQSMKSLQALYDKVKAKPVTKDWTEADKAEQLIDLQDSMRTQQTKETPAAAVAPAAASTAPKSFSSAADIKAAIANGGLKSGDYFIGPDGKKRKVN